MSTKIPVLMINGFLGAGKTTLMKRLIDYYRDKKTAIIVNEFGKIDVDGIILSEDELDIVKIDNGSIFCSCKSDKFVDALVKVTDMHPDIIIVESSGLANPSSMPRILQTVMKLTDNSMYVKGVIGVMDATNLYKLINTAVVVKNQIAYSDVILLNKIDLVGADIMNESIGIIREYNKKAKIIETKYCEIPEGILDNDLTRIDISKESLPPNQKLLGIQNIIIEFDTIVDTHSLKEYLGLFIDRVYRIKGFVNTDKGWKLVEGSSGVIEFTQSNQQDKSYLVVLSSGQIDLKILNDNAFIVDNKIKIN